MKKSHCNNNSTSSSPFHIAIHLSALKIKSFMSLNALFFRDSPTWVGKLKKHWLKTECRLVRLQKGMENDLRFPFQLKELSTLKIVMQIINCWPCSLGTALHCFRWREISQFSRTLLCVLHSIMWVFIDNWVGTVVKNVGKVLFSSFFYNILLPLFFRE